MAWIPLWSQYCSDQQTFTWEGAYKGNKAVWNVDDTLRTYSDIYGLNVEVRLRDPFKQNTNTQNPSIFNDFTETNTFFGRGSLAFQITAQESGQNVCLDFNFSKPVTLQNFSIWDIDYIANLRHPEGNYQDYIELSAQRGEENVPLILSAQSAQPSFSTQGQTIIAHYTSQTQNDLHHTDPAGALTISSTDYISTFSICYSNGPADEGLSNGQAMRIPQFSFCQKLGELSGYTLEVNTLNAVAGVHILLQYPDGKPVLNDQYQPVETYSDVYGQFVFLDIPLGEYRIVQSTPENFNFVQNKNGQNTEYNEVHVVFDTASIHDLNFYYSPKNPLSVGFFDWNVRTVGKEAHIVWQTLSETQSDAYYISVSADGKLFDHHGDIQAKGFSSSSQMYSYSMVHPYTKDYYIRLSERDLNGDIRDLGIRKVNISSPAAWHIFPNPASDKLTLKFSEFTSVEASWTITDIMGKQYTSDYLSGETTDIDISYLPQGIYIMQVNDGGHQNHVKFIKK
jgi:hypothetical protein